MCAETKVAVSQTISRDAIAGIIGLIDDGLTALVTCKGHNEMTRTDILLQSMPQGLVDRTVDETLNSTEFKSHLLRKIEEASSSPRHVTKGTKEIWEIHDFIAQMATIFKQKLQKAMDITLKREDRRHKFVEAANSTGTRSTSLSDGPPTDISNEQTNKKAYSQMTEEPAPEFPSWSGEIACNKSKRYTPKPEKRTGCTRPQGD